MSALKGVTSLEKFPNTLGEKSTIEEGWFGGRKVKLKDKEGKTLGLVTINDLTKKLKEFTCQTSEVIEDQGVLGERICQQIIDLDKHKVSGFIKKILTFFRRTISHCWSGNPKKELPLILQSFQIAKKVPAAELTPVELPSTELPIADLPPIELPPAELPIVEPPSIELPKDKALLQEKSKQLVEAFVAKDKDVIEALLSDELIKDVLEDQDEEGNTVLHHLAERLQDCYDPEFHDLRIAELKAKGASVDTLNKAGKSPFSIGFEINEHSRLGLAFLPPVETFSFDFPLSEGDEKSANDEKPVDDEKPTDGAVSNVDIMPVEDDVPVVIHPAAVERELLPSDRFMADLELLIQEGEDTPAFYAGEILKNLFYWMTHTENAPVVKGYSKREDLYTIEFVSAKKLSIKPILDAAQAELNSEAFKQKVERGEASGGIRRFFPMVKKLLGSGKLKVPKVFKVSVEKKDSGDVFVNFFESTQVENRFLLPNVTFMSMLIKGDRSMLIKGGRTEIELTTLGKKNVRTADFSNFLKSLVS